MWERWSEFRRRQRAALRESNRVPMVIDDDTTYDDPGWAETAEEHPVTGHGVDGQGVDGQGSTPPGTTTSPGTGPAPTPHEAPPRTPRLTL